MIRLVYGPIGSTRTAYYSSCPFCCAEITFNVVSPVLCPKCAEELPELEKLDDELEYRLSYHNE